MTLRRLPAFWPVWTGALLLAAGAGLTAGALPRGDDTAARLERMDAALLAQERLELAVQAARNLPGGAAGDNAAGRTELRPALAAFSSLTAEDATLRPARVAVEELIQAALEGQPARPRTLDAALSAAEEAIRQRSGTLRLERERAVLRAVLEGLAVTASGLLLALLGCMRAIHRRSRRTVRLEAEIRAALAAAPAGMALLDNRLRARAVNATLAAMAGRLPETLRGGEPLRELLPQLTAALLPAIRKAVATGTALSPQEAEVEDRDGRCRRYRISGEPLAGGAKARLCLAVMDVTEQAAAAAWREESVAELNHRVKNILATVQSLAAQTLRGARNDPQRFAADFSARLGALSRSHEMLAAAGWSRATLEDAVRAGMAPWLGTGRVDLAGPPGPVLRPAEAQALVVALSELAGNALRHGALSTFGHVSIRWEVSAERQVRLTWQEQGGPPLSEAPRRSGFGLRFLQRGLPHELGAEARVRLRFEPPGLSCEIRFRAAEPNRALAPRAA